MDSSSSQNEHLINDKCESDVNSGDVDQRNLGSPCESASDYDAARRVDFIDKDDFTSECQENAVDEELIISKKESVKQYLQEFLEKRIASNRLINDSPVRDISEMVESQSKKVDSKTDDASGSQNQTKVISTTSKAIESLALNTVTFDAKKFVDPNGLGNLSIEKESLRSNPCYINASSSSSSVSSSFSSFALPINTKKSSQKDQQSTTVTVSTCPRCGSEAALDSDRSKPNVKRNMSKYSMNKRWKGMRNVYRNSLAHRSSPYNMIYPGGEKIVRKNRPQVYRSSDSSDVNQNSRKMYKNYQPKDRHASCYKPSNQNKLWPNYSLTKPGCPYSLTMPDDHLMSHLCDINSWHRKRKRAIMRRKEKAIIFILAVFAVLIFIAMSYFGTVLFLRITTLPS